jgi:hypothetical protein
MTDYFTDREFGARPRTSEIIDDRLWNAFQSLIDTRIDDGGFGYRFPLACPDHGANACGADRYSFASTLQAEVPWINWPYGYTSAPETPVILDVLEFCASAVGTPIVGAYHSGLRHHHLTWDRQDGLARFVADVNRLFSRNGVAFELTQQGKAQRLLPAHLGQALVQANFRTGDPATDALLETARSRFLAPKIEDRRDGLEKLWDAFERIKTLETGVKKIDADRLLDMASRAPKLRHELAEEAAALTRIGNNHLIRHWETTQEPLETSPQVDYLFGRLFAFIHLLLTASNRIG